MLELDIEDAEGVLVPEDLGTLAEALLAGAGLDMLHRQKFDIDFDLGLIFGLHRARNLALNHLVDVADQEVVDAQYLLLSHILAVPDLGEQGPHLDAR